MRYRLWLPLGLLTLATTFAWMGHALADTWDTKIIGDSSTLTVDVVPLSAEVRLNGVRIGTAHDLIGRSIPLTPGKHIMEIGAPGYLPATVDVSATVDWATRVWVQLIPDRR